MCPLVSGIASRDAALSTELGMRALDLALGSAVLDHTGHNAIQETQQPDSSASTPDTGRLLKPGGHLIIKILESEDTKGLVLPSNSSRQPLYLSIFLLIYRLNMMCSLQRNMQASLQKGIMVEA